MPQPNANVAMAMPSHRSQRFIGSDLVSLCPFRRPSAAPSSANLRRSGAYDDIKKGNPWQYKL
ncbi:MAG TPA: hypothetical protein VIR01_17430 [Pyrinomonadaceae bacterium]